MAGELDMSPEGVAWLLGERERAHDQEQGETVRRARMIELGARLAELREVWDLLAQHGIATPRPSADSNCSDPCRVDGHYLTISQPDGSMHHTVHVDAALIESQNDGPGPEALEEYRYIAKRSLLRIEPPDRPAPSRVGSYVVTPPAAANVSAASIVEITEDDRGQAWAEHHRAHPREQP